MKTPTEIPLKQWRYEEAKRLNVDETTIAHRLREGGYPLIRLRKVNSRVIFVQQPLTLKP
jgi:hypothetical protein